MSAGTRGGGMYLGRSQLQVELVACSPAAARPEARIAASGSLGPHHFFPLREIGRLGRADLEHGRDPGFGLLAGVIGARGAVREIEPERLEDRGTFGIVERAHAAHGAALVDGDVGLLEKAREVELDTLLLRVEAIEDDREAVLMRARNDFPGRRIALASGRADMDHPASRLRSVGLDHRRRRIDLESHEAPARLPVPGHAHDIERRRRGLDIGMIDRDRLAVDDRLDRRADGKFEADIGARGRRSDDRRVLGGIALGAGRVAAARVLEVEQSDIAILPFALRQRDRRALAFGVDQLEAIDIEPRFMKLRGEMSAAEIGERRPAADLLAVGRQREGNGDGCVFPPAACAAAVAAKRNPAAIVLTGVPVTSASIDPPRGCAPISRTAANSNSGPRFQATSPARSCRAFADCSVQIDLIIEMRPLQRSFSCIVAYCVAASCPCNHASLTPFAVEASSRYVRSLPHSHAALAASGTIRDR